ncbi:rhombosortase [Pseudoalteromonas sp. SSDWG2]|uniref:rhombosortase n=1 Tax=Pseudoalteromonas sp. SSDWG2 TaxID=3139391 RepID=UPI003BA878E7
MFLGFNIDLRFDRDAIANGQWYRILTSNFVHSNDAHLAMNMAGVGALWLLHHHFFSVTKYWLYLCAISLVTTLLIYIFSSNIDIYVGLSGTLHGLIAYGAIKDLQNKEKTGWLLLVGVIAKVTYEQTIGASSDLETLIESRVAIEAHLFGLLCGLALGAIELLSIKKPKH